MPFLYESLSVLIIRSLTKEDFGAYYCVAKNEYGEQKATVELISKLRHFLTYLIFNSNNFLRFRSVTYNFYQACF